MSAAAPVRPWVAELGEDHDKALLALSVALYHVTEARTILHQCANVPRDLVTACHNLEADIMLAMGGLEPGDFEREPAVEA